MTPLDIFIVGVATIIIGGGLLVWINDRAEAWAKRRNGGREC